MSGRRKLLTTLHVIGSASNLGVVVVLVGLTVTGVSAGGGHAGGARWLAGVVLYAVGVPLLSLAVLTGVVGALCSPWGLFRHTWVVKKLVLTLVNLLIALVVVGPWIGRTGASTTATVTVLTGLAAQLGLLVLVTVLSVYKPKGRVGVRAATRVAEPAGVRS